MHPMTEENSNPSEETAAPPERILSGELLDHVEETFSDSYRKEIDQEENVWRSLPFFAASLSLQIVTIIGVSAMINDTGDMTKNIAIFLLFFGCSINVFGFGIFGRINLAR
jgi:hypothetical protein